MFPPFSIRLRGILVLVALFHLSNVSPMITAFRVQHTRTLGKVNEKFDEDLRKKKEGLTQTIISVTKLLNYFDTQRRNVNLDAVIGIRILEGQINVILNRLSVLPDVLNDDFLKTVKEKLKGIGQSADSFCQEAIPNINRSTPQYYKKLWPILTRNFWTTALAAKHINPNVIYEKAAERESMSERDSDNCVSELFALDRMTKCRISDHCWELMTSPGYRMYSLSHEIFYLLIGTQYGCRTKIEEKIAKYKQGSLNKLYEEFCSNMWYEASHIASHDFQEIRQDLFMEQGGLCGMLGFVDFFSNEWLRRILSWQRPNGCYSTTDINDIPKSDKQLTKREFREKRYEKVLNDGCLSHKTTIAATVLSQYIRYDLNYIIYNQYHISVDR